jgi:hypothetical protein
MHLKSLILGIVIGAALGIGTMFVFGDELLGDVGDATQEVGKTVRDAGKTLEKAGDKLK